MLWHFQTENCFTGRIEQCCWHLCQHYVAQSKLQDSNKRNWKTAGKTRGKTATNLNHGDNLHLIEEDEGAKSGQCIVINGWLWRCRENNIHDILHPVGLMNLLNQRHIVEGNHLATTSSCRITSYRTLVVCLLEIGPIHYNSLSTSVQSTCHLKFLTSGHSDAQPWASEIARMSKTTNDDSTQSGIGCFIAVPIW